MTQRPVQVDSPGGILLPRCSFCSQVPKDGIHGGMMIRKAFICYACEQEIVSLDVGSNRYQLVVNKLKEIFR